MNAVKKGGVRVAIAAAVAVVPASSAMAATSITTDATALSVSLSALGGLLTGTVGPLGPASGTASSSGSGYDVSSTPVSVHQSLLGAGSTQTVNATALTASAQSSFPTTNSGTATSSVANLSLGLSSILNLIGVNALSVTAPVISSTTTWNGTSFAGTVNLANLALGSTLLTLPAMADLSAGVGANTVLVDMLGLKIVANEQITTDTIVNNVRTQGLTTNALHITYSGLGSNLATGDILVAQSDAKVTTAVPEPATWAMMLMGFGMLGWTLRRKPAATNPLSALA